MRVDVGAEAAPRVAAVEHRRNRERRAVVHGGGSPVPVGRARRARRTPGSAPASIRPPGPCSEVSGSSSNTTTTIVRGRATRLWACPLGRVTGADARPCARAPDPAAPARAERDGCDSNDGDYTENRALLHESGSVDRRDAQRERSIQRSARRRTSPSAARPCPSCASSSGRAACRSPCGRAWTPACRRSAASRARASRRPGRSSSVARASTCLRFAADGFADSIDDLELALRRLHLGRLEGLRSRRSPRARGRPREHAHVVAERPSRGAFSIFAAMSRGASKTTLPLVRNVATSSAPRSSKISHSSALVTRWLRPRLTARRNAAYLTRPLCRRGGRAWLRDQP